MFRPTRSLISWTKNTRNICHNRILREESSIRQNDQNKKNNSISWDEAARASGANRRTKSPAALENAMKQLDEMRKEKMKQDEARLDIDQVFMPKFQTGNIYDPFDFSLTKQRLKISHRRRAKSEDTFERSGINPLDLWTKPTALSNFLSANGRILPGRTTGVKGKNQKKLAKAIRRARATGLLSAVHKDVDLLPKEEF